MEDSFELVAAAVSHRVYTQWGSIAFYKGDGRISHIASLPKDADMLTIAVRKRGHNDAWHDIELSCQWPSGRADAEKLCWMLDGAFQRGGIAKAEQIRKLIEAK